MEEEISQVWVIVASLTLLPRRNYLGEYTIEYLQYINEKQNWVERTNSLGKAATYSSAEAAEAVINTKCFKSKFPSDSSFAMLISETITKRNIHYLDQNSVLHQKIQALVDEVYAGKEIAHQEYLETLKRISSTEETQDSAK